MSLHCSESRQVEWANAPDPMGRKDAGMASRKHFLNPP
jgi:hypothetical protein